MKKPNSTFVVLATLVFALTLAPFAKADQVPGQGVVTSGKVALSKGTYQTFTLASVSGVTPTVTGTVSGTIANLSVTGSGLIATVSTTVTSTLDKKTIAKGKIGNKELLQLILNTTDSAKLKGQSLVWASVQGGLLTALPTTGAGGNIYVGAANLKSASPTVNTRPLAFNTLGIEGNGNVEFLSSVVASKKVTNELTATGIGNAGVVLRGSVPTVTKSLISSTTVLTIIVDSAGGNYKETYIQNQATGVITNSSKGSFSTKPNFGTTQKAL